MNLKEKALSFFKSLEEDKDYIFYNEASFQNDLAFYLKTELEVNKYRIVVERSISNDTLIKLKKRFVDITIINRSNYEKAYIEIKFPKGSKYQKRIENCMIDINFLTSIKAQNMNNQCLFIFLTPKSEYKNKLGSKFDWHELTNANFESDKKVTLYYFISEI